MSLFINNGLSGLIASQRALETISNNVANANTEGYVRQEVNLVSRPGQALGSFSIGTGVAVSGINRIYDSFLGNELQSTTMSQGRAQSFNEMATRLDGLLGNPDLNINVSVQKFFEQLEAVNREPTSIVNREQLLSEGESLATRFRQIDAQLSGLTDEVDDRLQQSVNSINDTAASLAEVNERLASSSSNAPNDLLDEQARLLNRLAEQIDFTQTRQSTGAVTVTIGSGQPLVLDVDSFELALIPSEFDGSRLELAYDGGNTLQRISSRVAGGEVAGFMAFRNDALDHVGRQLGQMALGISEAFNEQHSAGIDLNGDRGGDFFKTLDPSAAASVNNSGTSAVASITYGDVASIAARDYKLLFDGAAWQLSDAVTGSSIPLTGTGIAGDPFIAEGLEFVMSGTASSGDSFRLQPVSRIAGGMGVEVLDYSKIAVASLLNGNTPLQNVGNGSLAGVVVDDPSNPNVQQAAGIVFDDASTYRILDGGGADLTGPLAYTSGANISLNGWTTQITGAPLPGDRFDIAAATGGTADNTNGLALSAIAKDGFFGGGSVSVESLGASMLTTIGSTAARSSQDLLIQTSLRDQAELDLQTVSGVNLEEEAANLLRYQEAYQASARVISVANDLFQTLMGVFR